MANAPQKDSWRKRIAWLVVLWLASILSLGLVSLLIKLCMAWAGFDSA